MTSGSGHQSDLEKLIVGHFDDSLTGQQETELAEALSTSAVAKQLFVSYMRMEGRLHSLGRDGFLRDPASEETVALAASGLSAAEEGAKFQSVIDSPDTPIAPSTGRSRRVSIWAVSTALAVGVGLVLTLMMWPAPVSASRVLQRAQEVAAEMVDRRYRLVESRPEADGGLLTRELVITARGGGRFVLQPDSAAYVMGYDGSEYWMARRNGPVCVTGDFRTLAPELKKRIPQRSLVYGILASPEEPLLLDMAGLLQLIDRKYDVELVDSGDSKQHHVVATRRSGVRRGALVIRLEADSVSGVVLRAEMQFADSGKRMFEMIETPTLSNGWYHYSEHAPDREIERLDVAE